METNTLRSHFDRMIESTEKQNLTVPVLKEYKKHYEEIFRHCMAKGKTSFSMQDAEEYCAEQCSRSKRHKTKRAVKTAYTVAYYFTTGKFLWKPVAYTQHPIPESYEELLDMLRKEMLKDLGSGTVRCGLVIARQFFRYLAQAGTTDASKINTETVLNFVRREAPRHKGSMPKLVSTMRKLVRFLRDKGIADIDADRFLTSAGRHRQKALPCFSEDELHRIFTQIDRSTNKGRRDYAIFLTALRTGLREGDISSLKLDDIDWNQRMIRIIQRKTKTALQIPLPIDAGNAIADYILHSRYKSDSPYVFLRLKESNDTTPIAPTSFNFSLRRYMEAAGIERIGWDGKSFHALRRTAGTRMITSGTPASTIAQVLGHSCIESTKRYIALNTEGLRECCLGLGQDNTRKEGLS